MPEQEEADTQPPAGDQSPDQDALPEDQYTVVQPIEVDSSETSELDSGQPVAQPIEVDSPETSKLDSDQPVAQPVEADSPDSTHRDSDQSVAQPVEVDSPESTHPDPAPQLLIPAHATTAGLEIDDAPLASPEPQTPAPEPRRLSRAERDTLDRHLRRFGACGRCGYFIADCRLYLGEEQFQDAVLDARDGWVRMEGDRTFHRLAADAYGIQLDTLFDSFSGTCPECRRRFDIFNTEEGLTRLKIHV